MLFRKGKSGTCAVSDKVVLAPGRVDTVTGISREFRKEPVDFLGTLYRVLPNLPSSV